MKHVDAMRGPWIRTFTGGKFYPFDPQPEEVRIGDIAHSLSLQCRFTGHSKRHYSVAEHSLHVAELVPAEYRLEALLHDASEAYLSDVCTPLKHSSAFCEYRDIEARVQSAVHERFGLFHKSDVVREADAKMLAIEAYHLMGVRYGDGWDRWLELVDTELIERYEGLHWDRQPEEIESRFRREVVLEASRMAEAEAA